MEMTRRKHSPLILPWEKENIRWKFSISKFFPPKNGVIRGRWVAHPISDVMAVPLSIVSAFTWQHLVSRTLQIFPWPLSLSSTKNFSLKLLFCWFLCSSLRLNTSPSAIFLPSYPSFPSCSVPCLSPFPYMLHCPICFRSAHGSVSAMMYIPLISTSKNAKFCLQSVLICSIWFSQ